MLCRPTAFFSPNNIDLERTCSDLTYVTGEYNTGEKDIPFIEPWCFIVVAISTAYRLYEEARAAYTKRLSRTSLLPVSTGSSLLFWSAGSAFLVSLGEVVISYVWVGPALGFLSLPLRVCEW